jgi:hypothetical protein
MRAGTGRVEAPPSRNGRRSLQQQKSGSGSRGHRGLEFDLELTRMGIVAVGTRTSLLIRLPDVIDRLA